jgi:hypothetical protein
MGEKINAYRFAIGKPEQRDPLEDPEVDKCTYIFKWLLNI